MLGAERLVEVYAKTTTEALAKLQVRLDEATKKFQDIRKGVAERKAGQIKIQMVAKVAGVEKKVEETAEAYKALETIEASANFSAEKANAECEKLAGLVKDAQKLIDDALAFLVEKEKDVKNTEEEKKDLQTRLTTAQTELAKCNKALSEFEQRFEAQKLLGEANGMVEALEAEVAKVTASCAPLLEEGGSTFLAATTVAVIAEALKEHLVKASTTKADLFKEAGGTGEKIGKDVFMAWLDKLPEEQRDGIFAHIDADKDGEVSMADFEGMFPVRYMCVQAISITDGFEIAKSKVVVKLAVDDVVEILGAPRITESTGMTRIECRTVETAKQGWVTMKGNQATVYLDLFSPYNPFVKATDRLTEAVSKTVSKSSNFIAAKSKALASTPKGPLADARTELGKLKPKVSDAEKAIAGLKSQLAQAKKDYVRKQQLVVEAKDRKAAAMLMKGIKDKVEIMDANAAKLAELTKPLLSASDAESDTVSRPLPYGPQAAGMPPSGSVTPTANRSSQELDGPGGRGGDSGGGPGGSGGGG